VNKSGVSKFENKREKVKKQLRENLENCSKMKFFKITEGIEDKVLEKKIIS
jgi:chromosome segregation ATPase